MVGFIDEDEIPRSALEYLPSAVPAPRQMRRRKQDGERRPWVRPVRSQDVVAVSVNESDPSNEGTSRQNFSQSSSCHWRCTDAGTSKRIFDARFVRRSSLTTSPASIVLPSPNLVSQKVGPWPGLENARSYRILMRPRFDRKRDEADARPTPHRRRIPKAFKLPSSLRQAVLLNFDWVLFRRDPVLGCWAVA